MIDDHAPRYLSDVFSAGAWWQIGIYLRSILAEKRQQAAIFDQHRPGQEKLVAHFVSGLFHRSEPQLQIVGAARGGIEAVNQPANWRI